tara:strand:+ start:27246 stop:27620 length:375 start_codon:yes stop_codon:yes gene_type:complete
MIKFVRRWRRARRLKQGFVESVERAVDGVGVVNITPMSTQMYFIAGGISESDFADKLSLWAWLGCECVVEYFGLTPVQLSNRLSPIQLVRLGAEVMDVSGLTARAQEALEKKSEPAPETVSSGT